MSICDFKSTGDASALKECTICDPTWDTDRLPPTVIPQWGNYFAELFNIKLDGPPVYSQDNIEMLAAMHKMIWQIGLPVGLSSAWLGRITKADANVVQSAGYLEESFLGQFIYEEDKTLKVWRKPLSDTVIGAHQYLAAGVTSITLSEGDGNSKNNLGYFTDNIQAHRYNFAFKLVKTNSYGGTQLKAALLSPAKKHVRAKLSGLSGVLQEINFLYVDGIDPPISDYFNVHIPFVWGPVFEKWIRKNALDRCCIGDYNALDHTVVDPITKTTYDKDSYNLVTPSLYDAMKKVCTDASLLPNQRLCDDFMQNNFCKRGAPTANDIQCSCLNIRDVSSESLRLMNVSGQTHCMSCRCTKNINSYKMESMVKNPCQISVCQGGINTKGVAQYVNANQTIYCDGKTLETKTDCGNGDPCLKGKCIADGTCQCDENVYGPTCAYINTECKKDDECSGGIQGKCITGKCQCIEGFTGVACDIPLAEFEPDNPYPTTEEKIKMKEKQAAPREAGIAIFSMWVIGALIVVIGAVLWGLYTKNKAGPITFSVGIIVIIAASIWFFVGNEVVLPFNI